jgi:hypothetical protein
MSREASQFGFDSALVKRAAQLVGHLMLFA